MEQARPIGEILPAATEEPTSEPASNALATKTFSELDLTVLDRLPARLSDSTMAALADIMNCALPADQGCDDEHFAACMRSLATLPTGRGDEVDGKLRYSLYKRKLSGFSNAAMSHLVSQALERCKFFPTIHECLGLLRGWNNRQQAVDARRRATNARQNELQLRMEETMDALSRGDLDGEEIAALPEWCRRIAEARGLLWNDGDGKYRPRPNRAIVEIREGVQPKMDL